MYAKFLAVFAIFATALLTPFDCATIKTKSESRGGIAGNFDLSGDGRFEASWELDLVNQLITFEVTARTTGFVGFGVSRSGIMPGSDIVIGGIYPNGTIYFADRFAMGNAEPITDYSQDWHLLAASENSTHTKLSFSRLLDTGDEWQDLAITPEQAYKLSIVWSFGANDTISYHSENRGSSLINFFS